MVATTHRRGSRRFRYRHTDGSLFAIAAVIALTTLLLSPARSGASEREVPKPPAGLEYVERQEDLGLRVTLSWHHDPAAAGYRVYRSDSPSGSFECVGGISAQTFADFPFFLDDDIIPGKTFFYRVTALDDEWREGAPSETVRAEPPAYRRSSAARKSMTCSIADQRVYCYEDGVVVNIFRCSTGAGGTPTGNYRIYSHRRYVYGGTYVCEYWMDWKPNYGMHSWPRWGDGYRDYEESLGVRPRSRGCIRLHPLEAYWPYHWAPDGTPLTVTGASLGRLPLQGASCSNGASSPSKTWYFAEGFTGGEFTEYLLLFNPGARDVTATATYYPENGPPVVESYNIPAMRRVTIFVNTVSGLPPSGHATKIEADGEIVAQQSEYYDYGGRRGGHLALGAPRPRKQWFFAEGYTGGLFDSYLLLFNPHSKPAPVTVSFHPEGGSPVEQRFILPPLYRGTTLMNAVPGLAGTSVSCRVQSERPIVAARTIYFGLGAGSIPNGVNGGDCVTGTDRPGKTWYLAEGCTAHYFDEYILVQNTEDEVATVSAVFFPPTGPYGHRFQVAPRSRGTLSVDSIPGLENTETPAMLTADRDIVVERAMYCSRDSRRGGHASTAVSEPSTAWYFAEGYTGGTFDEYILLLNPGEEPASVSLVFHTEQGTHRHVDVGIPPRARITVHVDEIPGLEWVGSAVEIHSDRPVVAEQAQYFCVPR